MFTRQVPYQWYRSPSSCTVLLDTRHRVASRKGKGMAKQENREWQEWPKNGKHEKAGGQAREHAREWPSKRTTPPTQETRLQTSEQRRRAARHMRVGGGSWVAPSHRGPSSWPWSRCGALGISPHRAAVGHVGTAQAFWRASQRQRCQQPTTIEDCGVATTRAVYSCYC